MAAKCPCAWEQLTGASAHKENQGEQRDGAGISTSSSLCAAQSSLSTGSSSSVMNWAQRGVREQLEPCAIPTLTESHFLRISVPLFRFLWQKEPGSDVNWSEVFPRSYLNLITPMKAAPHPTPSAGHYYWAQRAALFIIFPISSHNRDCSTTADVAAFKNPKL